MIFFWSQSQKKCCTYEWMNQWMDNTSKKDGWTKPAEFVRRTRAVNPDKWINLGDTSTLLVWRIPSREISSQTSSPDHDEEDSRKSGEIYELPNWNLFFALCLLWVQIPILYITDVRLILRNLCTISQLLEDRQCILWKFYIKIHIVVVVLY